MNNDLIVDDLTIKIVWDNQNGSWWNLTCADIMEVFGLPGNKYVSTPTADYMLFTFKSKRDADLCRILVSEKL